MHYNDALHDATSQLEYQNPFSLPDIYQLDIFKMGSYSSSWSECKPQCIKAAEVQCPVHSTEYREAGSLQLSKSADYYTLYTLHLSVPGPSPLLLREREILNAQTRNYLVVYYKFLESCSRNFSIISHCTFFHDGSLSPIKNWGWIQIYNAENWTYHIYVIIQKLTENLT